MIDPMWAVVLGICLFTIGLWGAGTRKNAIIVLMCIEIILNAVNLNFVAAAAQHGDVTGWVYTVFAIAIAAAEVAVGLALIIVAYRMYQNIDVADFRSLKG